ncbi:MAG: hypothetical protein Q4C50_11965 [Eubacteriales bacterium]|nr:hypothetical protein [Eubacteriales bacterium]
MRNYCVGNTRILHFEKYLSHEEENPQVGAETKKGSAQDREYRSYFSLGYYDQLSYVRCKEEPTFDYRHCFLLKYPYRESRRQMITDQVFTLNDTEERIGENDPFEYQGDRKMPFLGIVLVTASGEAANDKCVENIYDQLILALQKECESFFGKFDADCFFYKYFYTPNCADLCIALRTAKLDYIYRLKQHLSGLRPDIGENCRGVFHAISYTVVEPSTEVWGSDIVEQNKEIGIEMRLSGPGDKMGEIMQCLLKKGRSGDVPQGEAPSEIHGITGAGQYAMEVDFAAFAEIYPFLGMIKLDSPEPVNCDKLTELQKCFNNQELECSYMRAKYAPMVLKEEEGAQEWESQNGWIVAGYKEEIRNLRKQIFAPSLSLGGMIREKEMMLKELFYTYNDFWYRPCSWWKGVWFYAQLECMMNGICTQTELIKKYVGKANEAKARGESAVEQEYYAERLAVKLSGDITLAVSAVNNFNRLLQSINQYVLNVPNYEIQTKVNVEKYLMAYTVYLLAISSTYRRQVEPEKKVVPFIALDLTIGGIKAASLFSMRESIPDGGELIEAPEICYVIRFPNYQWLANTYHALPMITHEISHNFRYMERGERNDFAGDYMLYRLAGRLLDRLMETADGERTLFYGELEHYLFRHIKESLQEGFEDSPYMRSEVRFQDMGEYVGRFFAERIGALDEKCRQHKRWELVAGEVRELVRVAEVVYIRAEDLAPEKTTLEAFITKSLEDCFLIYVNVIVDVLNTEKQKRKKCCVEWREAIERARKQPETDGEMQEVLKDILKFLDAFRESEQIASTDIWGIVKMSLKSWKKYNPAVANVYKEDKNFRKIFDELCEVDWLPEMQISLPKEENANIEISERMACYEKLNRIRRCAGNILTNLQGGSNARLRDAEILMAQYAKKLHGRLHDDYIERLKNRHSEENLWLTFKAEQTWLTAAGIVSSEETQFVEFFARAAAGITKEEILTIVADQSALYEEIFADMGMCKAFGFTAYGYFMYMIHIFMKERDVPRTPINNLTRDRVTILLFALYAAEIRMDDNWNCDLSNSRFMKELNAYWQDLREHLQHSDAAKEKMVEKLLECGDFYDVDSEHITKILSGKTDEKCSLKRQEKKQLEILRWMRKIYDELNLENWRIDECTERLIYHIRKSKDGMYEKKDPGLKKTWIELCREDESVRDIGEYYNNYSYSQIVKGRGEGRLLKYQDKFVAKNYARMFDCIHQIRCRMRPGKEKKILDLLFEYDFTAEGGQA